MKTRASKIILVNKLADSQKSISNRNLPNENSPFVLDPVLIWEKVDWINLDLSYGAFHVFYGELFDSLILEKRDLVVFWPTNTIPDRHWYEIISLCDSAGVKLESDFSQEPTLYNLSEDLLVFWKRFVEYLIKSIAEELNSKITSEEIAVLTHHHGSIVLLSTKDKNSLSFSYIVNTSVSIVPSLTQSEYNDMKLPEYPSFVELIENLNNELDLSVFQVSFQNSSMEKMYFNILRKQFSHINLINHWLANYSVN